MSQQIVIFAPSWGRRWSSPGVVNEAIASKISQLIGDRRDDYMIFAQHEVADALLCERIAADHVVRIPDQALYITTKHVVHEMCEEVRVHGFYSDFQYCLVAHPLHIDRCRTFLIQSGIPAERLHALASDELYDQQSIHPWTWNRQSYLLYESLYRLTAQFLSI